MLKNRGEGSGDARALEVLRHHISPPNAPAVAGHTVAAAAPPTHVIFVFRFELTDWRESNKFMLMVVVVVVVLPSWRRRSSCAPPQNWRSIQPSLSMLLLCAPMKDALLLPWKRTEQQEVLVVLT